MANELTYRTVFVVFETTPEGEVLPPVFCDNPRELEDVTYRIADGRGRADVFARGVALPQTTPRRLHNVITGDVTGSVVQCGNVNGGIRL
jgi:hypothetical protein